jgi:chemotaxis family two-component system response regulator Rcp1
MPLKLSSILILHVEDNYGDVHLLNIAFKKCNFSPQVKVINDGRKALDFLTRAHYNEKPDLIILDLNLPTTNGFEVLEFLKKNKQLSAIPVIVLSSSKIPDDIEKAYSLNAQFFITKSIDMDDMVEFGEACKHFAQSLLSGKGDKWEKFNCHENSMTPKTV